MLSITTTTPSAGGSSQDRDPFTSVTGSRIKERAGKTVVGKEEELSPLHIGEEWNNLLLILGVAPADLQSVRAVSNLFPSIWTWHRHSDRWLKTQNYCRSSYIPALSAVGSVQNGVHRGDEWRSRGAAPVKTVL